MQPNLMQPPTLGSLPGAIPGAMPPMMPPNMQMPPNFPPLGRGLPPRPNAP